MPWCLQSVPTLNSIEGVIERQTDGTI